MYKVASSVALLVLYARLSNMLLRRYNTGCVEKRAIFQFDIEDEFENFPGFSS